MAKSLVTLRQVSPRLLSVNIMNYWRQSLMPAVFNLKLMRLIQQYLSNKKHRAKRSNAYISWEGTFYGVPQRSILGHLILNTFLCDLSHFLDGIAVASYTKNITHFRANKTKYLVIKTIELQNSFSMVWINLHEDQ